MALEKLCGLDFRPSHSRTSFQDDILLYSQNFANSAQLVIPPFANPAETLAQFNGEDENGRRIKIEFHHGTTTLAFKYQGGVLLAVDSRATSGESFIGSQSVKKIVEINDYMLGTIAGGAADCVYWDRWLAMQSRLYELRKRERMPVAAASKHMANMVYNFKGMGLCMGMILAGFDKKKGAQLFYVDNDGTRIPGRMFSVGSGSVHAYGLLDSAYKWELSDLSAQELGRRAIYHATHRDAYSGGIIRIYHIDKKGWVNISNEDCSELHFKYQAENGVSVDE